MADVWAAEKFDLSELRFLGPQHRVQHCPQLERTLEWFLQIAERGEELPERRKKWIPNKINMTACLLRQKKCWTESKLWPKNRILLDVFFWAQLRRAANSISMQSWVLVTLQLLLSCTALPSCQNIWDTSVWLFLSRFFLFIQMKMPVYSQLFFSLVLFSPWRRSKARKSALILVLPDLLLPSIFFHFFKQCVQCPSLLTVLLNLLVRSISRQISMCSYCWGMEAFHPKNKKLWELFVSEIHENSAPKFINKKNLQLHSVDMHWVSVSLQTHC